MKRLKFLLKYYKEYSKHKIYNIIDDVNHEYIYTNIGILNPAIGTTNIGDNIIYQSVYKYLRTIFPNDIITDFPTQFHTTYDAMSLMSEKEMLYVSGTNLLSSNLEYKHQWKIHSEHKKYLKNRVILFGCGWWQYQGEINKYTADIYKTIFKENTLHSARDQYTVNKLKNIGIENIVNTSCPTLWDITPDMCIQVPKSKAPNVITTLTFYHKNPSLDKRMLEILSENYNIVYLWIQGLNDVKYFKELKLNKNNIQLLPPVLEVYDSTLQNNNVDYIGTRLHAGIRALQNKVRSLILAVDNRAIEIGKDVNLNVIKREDVEQLINFIDNDYVTKIKLPIENISRWKNSQKNQ